MGQTFSGDSKNQTTAANTQSGTPGGPQVQYIPGPEGPRGKDAEVDYEKLATTVLSNSQLNAIVRDGLVKDPKFIDVVKIYLKDNPSLFRGEKGETNFNNLNLDQKAEIVSDIIRTNKDEFITRFVQNQDLRESIIASLSKIPEIRGEKGEMGLPGKDGMPGKDGVVDYTTLSQTVVQDQKLQEAIRLGLVKDATFNAIITKYFKDNAVLFRGEKGITEFSPLSVNEKTAIVTSIVQQNKDEFVKGLALNSDFRQAVINALVLRPELKGPQGERGFPGPAGPTGPVGPQGKDGKDGKDAVIDYVQLGNTVTTPAFASRVGSTLSGNPDFGKIVSNSQDLRTLVGIGRAHV